MKITFDLSDKQIEILKNMVEDYYDEGCGGSLWKSGEASSLEYYIIEILEKL